MPDAEPSPGHPGDLVEAILRAREARWPAVALARATVEARLARLPPGAGAPTHLADLALAWAALAGDPAAQRELDAALDDEARRAVAALRRPAWQRDELRQELAVRLLVGSAGAEPRLASYAGRSALGRWLGVTATRAALDLGRRAGKEDLVDDHDDGALAAAVPELAPELAVLRARYAPEVKAAVEQALRSVGSPRDRNLLRLYYLDQVELEPLGRMLGVHASTVSRRLTALREAIAETVQARLRERLSMEGRTGELDSVIRAVHGQVELTLSRVLGGA